MATNLRSHHEAALMQDTAERIAKTLTRTQIDGLRRVRDHGALAWCKGFGRGGGSVSRMFDRMASAGLVTRAPHEITAFGRRVLTAIEDRSR